MMFSWGIEYRIGTLAGGRLRKTEGHNSFATLKLLWTQGLKQILPG